MNIHLCVVSSMEFASVASMKVAARTEEGADKIQEELRVETAQRWCSEYWGEVFDGQDGRTY